MGDCWCMLGCPPCMGKTCSNHPSSLRKPHWSCAPSSPVSKCNFSPPLPPQASAIVGANTVKLLEVGLDEAAATKALVERVDAILGWVHRYVGPHPRDGMDVRMGPGSRGEGERGGMWAGLCYGAGVGGELVYGSACISLPVPSSSCLSYLSDLICALCAWSPRMHTQAARCWL